MSDRSRPDRATLHFGLSPAQAVGEFERVVTACLEGIAAASPAVRARLFASAEAIGVHANDARDVVERVMVVLGIPATQSSIRVPEEADLLSALAQLGPGGTVWLADGDHRTAQPIEITTPVVFKRQAAGVCRIVGARPPYVIHVAEGAFLTAEGIQFTYDGSVTADVMVVDGTVRLNDCHVSGGVLERGEERGGDGVVLRDSGDNSAVCGCYVRDNGRYGIAVQGQARPTLAGNTCEANRVAGLSFSERSGGTARANRCRANCVGIYVVGAAQPTLEGNTCEENVGQGILYLDVGGGIARANVCRGNGSGLNVGDQAQPTLEDNTCEANAEGGIEYKGSASGTARANVCRNNRQGFYVTGQAQPALEANTCEANAENGIAYRCGASGTARANVCRGNQKNGLKVDDQARPLLESNTCEGNAWAGLAYFGSASGTARANVCRGNQRHGLYVGGQAQPTLDGNTCAANVDAGIAFCDWRIEEGAGEHCRISQQQGPYVGGQAQPLRESNAMADYGLHVIERFHFHASVSFGLEIVGPSHAFPLVLGCSLRTPDEQVVDLAARYIDSPGSVLWDVEADQRFKVGDRSAPGAYDGWSGSVIFALYSDPSFRERLADTGWMDWSAPWLIGASVVGVEENTQRIRERYASRFSALRSSPSLDRLVIPYVAPPAEIDPAGEARALAVHEARQLGVDLETRGAWVRRRAEEIAESLKRNRVL